MSGLGTAPWMNDFTGETQSGLDAAPWLQSTGLDVAPWKKKEKQVNDPVEEDKAVWQEWLDRAKNTGSALWQFTARGLEFLAAPHDLAVAAWHDAVSTARQALGMEPLEGEPLLPKFMKELPKYAPWGAEPDRRGMSAIDVLLNHGVDPRLATIVGLGTDFALDPFVKLPTGKAAAIERASALAEKFGLKAGKTFGEMTYGELRQIVDTLPPGPLRRSLRLAAITTKANELVTPAGIAKAIVPEPVRRGMFKGVLDIADRIPVPFATKRLVSEGGTIRRNYSFLEFALPKGTYEQLKLTGTAHEKVAKSLLGGGDILRPSTAQAGKLDYAHNLSRHIQAFALRQAFTLFDKFEKNIGKRPEDAKELWLALNRTAGEFVDKVGVGNFMKLKPGEIIEAAKRAKAIKFKSDDPAVIEHLKRLKETAARLARAYDVPEDRVLGFLEDAIRTGYATHLTTGYYLSGMHELDKIIRDVAGEDLDRARAWQAIWRVNKIGGMPTESDYKVYNKIKKAWDTSKLNEIYQVSFDDYVKSLYKGYIRRLVPISKLSEQNLTQLRDQFFSGKVRFYIAKTLDATNIVNAAEKHVGKKAADKLAAILYAYGDNAINTEVMAKALGVKYDKLLEILQDAGMYPKDIPVADVVRALSKPEKRSGFVDLIERNYGKDAAQKVEQVIASGDVDIKILANAVGVPEGEIQDFLKHAYNIDGFDISNVLNKAAMSEFTGRTPAAIELGGYKWKERIPDEASAKLLADSGLTERMMDYAQAAGRTIKSQEFVREAYHELAKAGFIRDQRGLKFVNGKWVDAEGVEYIHVPNSKDMWGPLANTFIPRYVADPMLRVIETGDGGLAQEALKAWRQLALSSPRTTLTNILSGIGMIVQGGIRPDEMASAARRAASDYIQFLRTGDPSKFGSGWKYLNLYAEGKLYGEAVDNLSREFVDAYLKAATGKANKNLYQHFEDFITGSGLSPLVWFEQSEDMMRLTAFHAVKRRLINAGMSEEAAGRAAAHVANNILFNYANQAPMTILLRKYGLSAFPAFPYFNLARTAKLAAERPYAITVPMHTTPAVNLAIAGFDPEEAKRRQAMVHGTYMENEMPLLFAHRDGVFAVPMSYYIPTFATSPTDPLYEVASGGMLHALMSVAYTLLNEGETPAWDRRYGRMVYESWQSPAHKAFSLGSYVAQQLMPGLPKQVIQLTSSMYQTYLGHVDPDTYVGVYGHGLGKLPEEALINFFVGGRVMNKMYGIRNEYGDMVRCQKIYNDALRAAQKVAINGNVEQAQRIKAEGLRTTYECIRRVRDNAR